VHLLYRDSRNFRPSLIRVRVVVEELVAEHESYSQQTVLATGLALDRRVGLLQPVDEEQCQENHILSNLRGRQNGRYPFPEAGGGMRIGDEGLQWLAW
jgi:hypothetical protein